MTLSFFDLHCDTAYEMNRTRARLTRNALEVSLEKASAFSQYIQVMALWTPPALGDEDGWNALLQMHEHLLSDPAIRGRQVALSSACPARGKGVSLLLSVEDARILNGNLDRVDTLAALGVRIVTPLWSGESGIGGAHNTSTGLTSFGRQAVRRMLSLGMTLDISHASETSAEEIIDLCREANTPVIASHSNAYRVCPVSRNLRDQQIRAVIESGGIIGLNLHRHFLSERQPSGVEDLHRHIDHLLELGADECLCFGCDMDGGELPPFVPDLSAIPNLVEDLLPYYPESLLQAIFFENAFHFAERHWSSPAKK